MLTLINYTLICGFFLYLLFSGKYIFLVTFWVTFFIYFYISDNWKLSNINFIRWIQITTFFFSSEANILFSLFICWFWTMI